MKPLVNVFLHTLIFLLEHSPLTREKSGQQSERGDWFCM